MTPNHYCVILPLLCNFSFLKSGFSSVCADGLSGLPSVTCAVPAKLILDKVGVDIAGMPKDAVTCPIPARPETTRYIRIKTTFTAQDHLIWVITNTPGSTVGPSLQLFGLPWLSSLSENKSTRKGRKQCKLGMLNLKLI